MVWHWGSIILVFYFRSRWVVIEHAAVQSWYRRSLVLTWRTESTHFCHSVMLPTSRSPFASWRAHPGRPKSSRTCDTDSPTPRPVFRTRQKEFLRFRKLTAKTSASSVCTHRSMDLRYRSLTTGVTFGQFVVHFVSWVLWSSLLSCIVVYLIRDWYELWGQSLTFFVLFTLLSRSRTVCSLHYEHQSCRRILSCVHCRCTLFRPPGIEIFLHNSGAKYKCLLTSPIL